MQVPISDFEIEMLDKVIHTHTFGEYHDLELSLRKHIDDEKDRLVASGKTTEHDFKSFQAKSVADIENFLVHNEFIGEREGRVHFLTNRGEQLRKQGTLQKYLDWEKNREVTLIEELHTIETKGYLDKDQVAVHDEVKKLHQDMKKKPMNENIPYYILIVIIIALLCWVGKEHFFK